MPDNSAQRVAAPIFAAPLFATLGDETRLRLVMQLGDHGPSSITGLTAGGALSRQAVTRHLGVLPAAGLVRSARLGHEKPWYLECQRLAQAQDWLEARSRDWDGRIDRLRALAVEQLQSSDNIRQQRAFSDSVGPGSSGFCRKEPRLQVSGRAGP